MQNHTPNRNSEPQQQNLNLFAVARTPAGNLRVYLYLGVQRLLSGSVDRIESTDPSAPDTKQQIDGSKGEQHTIPSHLPRSKDTRRWTAELTEKRIAISRTSSMRIAPPQVPDGAAEPIWKLATRAAIKLMPTALYSKRFIGASALLLYGYASYPIAEPTSTHSLRLAQGLDAHELDREDPFAINVRKIAARVGVKNPERISIRVGEQSAGASMGANLTVGQRGACIVLPMELYDAFYAPSHLHAEYDIPKRDEIDFVLAHESAHIAKNHSMYTGAFLPASLVSSCVAIHKIPNKLVAGIVGVLGIVGGNLYLSWSLEHEADQVAAESGFARGGISCFQRKLSRNCEMRSVLKTWMITEKGNYLGDTSHPLLTSRIMRLKLFTSAETIKLVVVNTEDDSSEADTC